MSAVFIVCLESIEKFVGTNTHIVLTVPRRPGLSFICVREYHLEEIYCEIYRMKYNTEQIT